MILILRNIIMDNRQKVNSYTKTFLIVLIATVALTSIKIQSASASMLLPTPVFQTAGQMIYDAIQERGFVVPQSTEEDVQSTENLTTKYTKKYTVTAYNSVPWQTDSTPCISADGSNVCELMKKGELSCAAALPFGTKINVPGFGVCTVRDRLAPKFSHRIDLYFGGADQIPAAKQWGKRSLVVAVLDEETI